MSPLQGPHSGQELSSKQTPRKLSSFHFFLFCWWYMTTYVHPFCLATNYPTSLDLPPVPSCQAPQSLLTTSLGPYPFLRLHTGPPTGCAVRPGGCATPAPSSQCASGPGKSQPLKKVAWSNTHKPAARGRAENWSDGNHLSYGAPTTLKPKSKKSKEAQGTVRLLDPDGHRKA